jgi:hypothetical protein
LQVARKAVTALDAKFKPKIAAANAQLMAAYGWAENTAAYKRFYTLYRSFRVEFNRIKFPSSCASDARWERTKLGDFIAALGKAAESPDSIDLIGRIVNVNAANDAYVQAAHDLKRCLGL